MSQTDQAISGRSSAHATFVIERTYEAAPARVWRAWADPEEKRRWFGPRVLAKPDHELEFRVGGLERMTVQAPDGALYTPAEREHGTRELLDTLATHVERTGDGA